jgi:GT2 family glycosyltransferase
MVKGRSNNLSTEPLVSVIIPTFNRKDDLLLCLNSLKNSTYPNLEIIVVDNASTDGTYNAVKQIFPDVKIVINDRNLGVTGGRNRGAIESRGDYLLFLDHDMIVDKQMIEELLKAVRVDPKIGIAGPIIYYYDEPSKVWAAGTSISMLTGKISFNDKVTNTKHFEVQVIPATIIVKREVLDKVGLFDETFFATYEDTDFCFRIRKAGYKVVCVPEAKAWHKIPIDSKSQELRLLSRSYYIARNRIIFMKKHARLSNFMVFLILFVPIYAIYYTWLGLRYLKLHFIKEYWRGLFEGLREIL